MTARRSARSAVPASRAATERVEVLPRETWVVVADTHGAPHPLAGARIRALRPSRILHAGDVGDLAVLDDLAAIAPVTAVRGNIDARVPGLPDVVTLEAEGAEGSLLRVLLTHIAVAGPRLRGDVAALAHAEGAGLVVCGHSHVPFVGRDRGVLVFNPGSIGPRRFHLPIVFGVLELEPERVSMRHVDVETGATWLPPAA